jgi:hypothetical protein
VENWYPPQPVLVDLFVRNMNCKILKTAVEMSMPKTLEEAIDTLLTEATELDRAQQKLGRTKTYENDQKKKNSGDSVWKSKDITCHECGEKGHIRPKCPRLVQKNESEIKRTQWKRAEDGRLRKVNAVSDGEQNQSQQNINVQCREERVTLITILDTGSDVSLVSEEAFSRLSRKGVFVRELEKEKTFLAAGNTKFTVHQEVELKIETSVNGRTVQAKIWCYVAPCTSELLIGYKDLKATGFIALLVPNQETPMELTNDEPEEEEMISHNVSIRDELDEIVTEYNDVFRGILELPADLEPFKIELTNAENEPPASPPRRQSPARRMEIERQVTELLEQGIIRPSKSSYAAPLVLVGKKNGETRMCVDYRQLNQQTRGMKHPIPNAKEIILLWR